MTVVAPEADATCREVANSEADRLSPPAQLSPEKCTGLPAEFITPGWSWSLSEPLARPTSGAHLIASHRGPGDA